MKLSFAEDGSRTCFRNVALHWKLDDGKKSKGKKTISIYTSGLE